MTIALVLDSSAMAAFAAGSVSVGELIVLVDEEAQFVALPAAALAQAFARTGPDDRGVLRMLVRGARSVVAPLDADGSEGVGLVARRCDLATAHAAVVATDRSAVLVTAEPAAFAGLVDKEMIIEVG
ncbi:hypothetical protein [Virgisporangium aurantiacum]|uniref:PIN domain-containing protein n=1 Tax=Virgisporangium aurantiacum TaxID=175570 RepID=A0A8J4E099_9ACTN|nr:hypothetical protein [Virgisporangium aurantiacum]GIJ56576.1 hypothetical protein Vau01_040920 [Virgisporangium aurantiacum]